MHGKPTAINLPLRSLLSYVLVLLIRGYDVHDCVANPQSLVS